MLCVCARWRRAAVKVRKFLNFSIKTKNYVVSFVTCDATLKPSATRHQLPQHRVTRCQLPWIHCLQPRLTMVCSVGLLLPTTTTTTLLPFYGPLSGTTRMSQYWKKHSPTHLSWSSTFLYQLLPSTTIHSILPVQFTCLTVFCTTSLQVLLVYLLVASVYL